MNNSDWRKRQKESWPTGSLERTLLRDFPGSRSLLDALKKTLLKNSPSSEELQENRSTPGSSVKTKEPTELEKYKALRESILTIEHYVHNGFDTWKVDEHVRKRLNEMPLNSILDAHLWRDCWRAEISKVLKKKS